MFIIRIYVLLQHVLNYAVHCQAIYMFLERKGNVYNADICL